MNMSKSNLKILEKKSNIMMENDAVVTRCGWVTKDQLYITYHDNEWGIPEYDGIRLFEMLCLEGQQAGLSWITILKKRQNYRKVFHNFNPSKISKLTDKDVKKILNNPGVVRHKGKIEAIINNSKCFLDMQNNGENFSEFVWSFVNNKPIRNKWNHIQEVPSASPLSTIMSKALKKKGFKYVGSTICYSFMQACGLVNDHIINCICNNLGIVNNK